MEEFAAHYESAYPKLTAVAAGILGSVDEAEDMVQQAVAIAVSKGEKFSSGSHMVGWLCKAVRNCSLNHRRKIINRKTQAADPVLMTNVVAKSANSGGNPEAIAKATQLSPDQREFDDQVLRALQSLAPVARTCLLLRVIHDSSFDEIAEIMEIPSGTAMSHVHRSKKRLRTLLEPKIEQKKGAK